MAEAIKVAVRVRPMNTREEEMNCECVVTMHENTCSMQRDGEKPKQYTYDYCYLSIGDDPKHSQEAVYNDVGETILNNAMDGFNGTLFTYGQTGSGKSYTVMGPPTDAGIIPRLMKRLYEYREESKARDREVCIAISYLEIYKEQVADLLVGMGTNKPASELKIMDHPKFGVYVKGLEEVPCESLEDVYNNLKYGMKKRVTAATNMNAKSSRSHAVFVIRSNILDGVPPKPGEKGPDNRKMLSSKVNLIDLAGSERQSKAETTGDRLKEGAAINQSLSSLGICIKALCDSHSKKPGGSKNDVVIPFRMSKLTFLLKDSLAGNSKTFMVATISPASDNYDETLGTLRFAASVKTIQTVAVVNKDKKDALIENMEDEIRALRARCQTGAIGKAEAWEHEEELNRLKEELQKDFSQQLQEAKISQGERTKYLEDHGGISQVHIKEAFGMEKGTPYLLNMADDPMLAGCLIYLLKENDKTTIGSAEGNTIKLQGVGISPNLATITNDSNTSLTLTLSSEDGRLVVGGRKLSHAGDHRALRNGDHIFLGRAYAMKLIMPEDPNGQNKDLMDLSLEGLEDQYAAIDDSESWKGFHGFLDQILHQMPADKATQLLADIKKACDFCDQANELTIWLRKEEKEALHFEVDITSAVPLCVVIRVLGTMEGFNCTNEEAWETKYLWRVHQLEERVERMREWYSKGGLVCEEYERIRHCAEDPWYQCEHAEYMEEMRSYEANYMEEKQVAFDRAMLLEKMKWQMSCLKLRTMMDTGENEDYPTLQLFLRLWRTAVLTLRAEKKGSKDPRKKDLKKRTASQDSHASRSSAAEKDRSVTPDPRGAGKRKTLLNGNPRQTRTLAPPAGAKEKSRLQINNDADVHHFPLSANPSARNTLVDEAPEATPDFMSQVVTRLSQEIEEPILRKLTTEFACQTAEEPEPKDGSKIDQQAIVVRYDETQAREVDILRRQLHDSRAESDQLLQATQRLQEQSQQLMQEKEELKRQQEVAWELCSVLRSYASQLLEHSPDSAVDASSPKASAISIGASSPSRTVPKDLWSVSSSPQPATMVHVSTNPYLQSFNLPIFSLNGATNGSHVAPPIAEVRNSPSAGPLLPPPMTVLPGPGSFVAPPTTVMEVPSPPTRVPPGGSAKMAMAQAMANLASAQAQATLPSKAFLPSLPTPSSPSQPSPAGASSLQMKWWSTSSPTNQAGTRPLSAAALELLSNNSPSETTTTLWRGGSGTPGTLAPPASIGSLSGLVIGASPQSRSLSADPYAAAAAARAVVDRQHSTPSVSSSGLNSAVGLNSAAGIYAALSTCRDASADRNAPSAWSTARMGVGALPSSRSASVDRYQAGTQLLNPVTTTTTTMTTAVDSSQRSTLSSLWGTTGAVGQGRAPALPYGQGASLPYARSVSAEPHINGARRTHVSLPRALDQRGDGLLKPGPVQFSACSHSPSSSVPILQGEGEEEARERGRLSCLEEQVRLIADFVGKPMSSSANDDSLAQRAPEDSL